MLPRFTAAAALAVAGLVAASAVAGAQRWNDGRTMSLVDLAIARRAQQLADTGLTDYRATAHGYLTFLAQVGEGFPDPPKVVRTDELAVEVYWHAPNQSKQLLIGRRDTLLLPTDIQYHRDHLAIVQNNFPSIIRLGEGDEVRDVPHPLSAAGRNVYDFAVTDSLTIRTNDRSWDVVEVEVRPKDDRLPRAAGAVYLDRATGSVVRMTLSFTRAALRDPQLEDVSIILENGLVDGRFWLPRRQEIEIRRTGTWLDFPARGIIRGRWDICCVRVNNGFASMLFAGPELTAVPPAQQRAYPFTGRILDSLPPDTRLSENDDVRRVQDQARELVGAAALSRAQATALSLPSLSDIVRMNRVEGIAVGGGISRRFGSGFGARGEVRYGTADRALKATLSAGWRRADGAGLAVTAHDDFRAAGDEPEVSLLRNTIAAQEFGSDFSDDFRSRGIGVEADAGRRLGARWALSLSRDREDPLSVHARPLTGAFQPAFVAVPLTAWRVALRGMRAESATPFGATARIEGTLSAVRATFESAASTGRGGWSGRVSLIAQIERPFGADRLVLHTTAAAALGANVPFQDELFFGGPVTAPGYDYHVFASNAGVSQRIEWRQHVASIPLPLGRFGQVAVPVGLAPFIQPVWTDRNLVGSHGQRGWSGSVGVGLLTLFDLLRFDVARGVRGGRWTFSADLTGDLWRIL